MAALLYAVFIIFSNVDQTVTVLSSFPLVVFFLMLLSALMNYLIRFIKWEYFIRKIGVRIPLKISSLCFLSGFSMTLTPAKSGELIKPWLLTRFGFSSGNTAPVVLIERITDLMGMLVLLVISAAFMGIGTIPVLILFIIVLFLILSVQYTGFSSWIRNKLFKSYRMKGYLPLFDQLLHSTQLISGPAPLFITILLSSLSWIFECFCLYIALKGLGYSINILSSVFIFAISTLAGLLVMIPGGLGATEGMMTVLLSTEGIPLDAAVTATLLTRVATLWFAVGIGMLALFIFNIRYPNDMND